MPASFQYEAHVPISLEYSDVEQVEKPIQSSRGIHDGVSDDSASCCPD